MKKYLKTSADVIKDLNSSFEGLSKKEAELRLEQNGKNKLQEAKKDSLFKKFLKSIADPMIIMLIAAAAIQAVVNTITAIKAGGATFMDFADVVVILAVVIINTIMSLVQEAKSEAAMEALMNIITEKKRILDNMLMDYKLELEKNILVKN